MFSFLISFVDVGIESRPVGERQDFSGVRVLDDHGTGDRLGVFDRLFEFALGDVLDFLVDGENEIFAGLGLLFDAREPFLAGIDWKSSIRPGLPRSCSSYCALDAAQAFVIGADVAEDLRRQLALGIETLGFFLEVNALQIQSANAVDDVGVRLARHPAESLVRAAIGQHHARGRRR